MVVGFLFSFNIASAHEAYVLPYNTFWSGIKQPDSLRVFDALKNPHDLKVTILIGSSVIILLIANFFFMRSKAGKKVQAGFEHFSYLGPHFVRISIAIALFFSAWSNTFLGPELLGRFLPFSEVIRVALFAMSIMIGFGFLTEVAALAGIVIFLISAFIFGPYMLNYTNYLGVFIVLALFGLRICSVDKYLFGPLRRFKYFEKYESVIVRVMYGFALIYAAITVKLLHPGLTLDVINTWNLTQFHWLFPSDPLLVTFGAGIVESLMGLFILIGFEMRLTILISLFYITLSLLYFRELVWPHLLLYGISFSLLVKPETYAIDSLLFNRKN